MNSFYVELSADEYGNRHYTNSFPCVIEAKLVEGDSPILIIKAPQEIADTWPHVRLHPRWLEVPGPARSLSWDEREKLITGYWKDKPNV